jgi:hypothetical protein
MRKCGAVRVGRRLAAVARGGRALDLVVMLAGLAVLAWYVESWMTVGAAVRVTRDFTDTYTAATLIRSGHAAQIYDWRVLAGTARPLMSPAHLQVPFLEVALVALLAVPLTPVPLATAFWVWSALQAGMVLAAVVIAVRAAGAARSGLLGAAAVVAVVLATPATDNLLSVGTSSGFNALGVALAYRCWRRGSHLAAGAWLVVTAALAKPHLALGILVFLVGWRNRRALVGAVSAGVAAAAAFVAIVGNDGVRAFLADAPKANTLWSARGEASVFALPSMWFDDTTMSYVLGVAFGCAALALCFLMGRRVRRGAAGLGAGLAAATVLSLLASPHAFLYDEVMIAPAVAWTLAEAGLVVRTGGGVRALPGVVLAWLAAVWLDTLVDGPLRQLVLRIGELDVWALVLLACALWSLPHGAPATAHRHASRGAAAAA